MSTTNTFTPQEAQSLVALCAILNGAVVGSPSPPPPQVTQPNAPSDWACIYNADKSHTFGIFNNTWQLWQNVSENQYAVVFQGTELFNIPEDLLFPLVRFELAAQVECLENTNSIKLQFPSAANAGAHAGFTYGALVMLPDVLFQLTQAIPPNGSTIFITGHSMGAAIATCATSILSEFVAQAKNFTFPLSVLFVWLSNISAWKTYVFAQPKPGNDYYSNEVNFNFSNNGLFYRTTQTLDWVPQTPLTLETLNDLNNPNPIGTEVKPWIDNHLPSLKSLLDKLEKEFTDDLQKIDAYLNTELKKELAVMVIAEEKVLDEMHPYLKSCINNFLDSITASVSIIPSLNYAASGTPVILQGDASVPTNPQDPNDFMWQHHAAQYYWLLSKHFNLPTNPAQQ